jgi:protein phosphatase 1G
MGQVLEKPILDKESDCAKAGGLLSLAWASTCMQGWRLGMEDAHICLQAVGSGDWASVGLFGVLDGHGGEQVAKFCQRHLPAELCSLPLALSGDSSSRASSLATALTHTFHRMDDMLRDHNATGAELRALTNPPIPQAAGRPQSCERPVDPKLIGCTACVCAITKNLLVVANAGDSRAVLCRAGLAVALSEDHKPNNPTEKKRIEAAGGYVETTGPGQHRVNGNLNLSRALGDLEYKQDWKLGPEEQIISATPDVHIESRGNEDEFLVLCCDGVWDVKSNQEVVDFIRSRLSASRQNDPTAMREVLEALLDDCVSRDLRLTRGLGGDNMTAVIVRLDVAEASQDSATGGLACNASSRDQLCLAGVKTICCRENGSCGVMVVRIATPTGCKLSDLSLRISEVTANLEVSCGSVRTFSLRDYLPKGAEFSPPASVPAKFLPKLETLRISLPWQVVK